MDLPFSPAADRNKQAILIELQRRLPPVLRVLEVAAGSGQHAQHFARSEPGWTWQPTDADASMPHAIDTRCAGLANVLPAQQFDLLAPGAAPPAATRYGAVYCANMLHISPWATCPALMRLAGARLDILGLLLIYGPFRRAEVPTAPSNEGFDASLKAQDPRWGLRDLADVRREAQTAGLELQDVVAMPANNLLLVFRR